MCNRRSVLYGMFGIALLIGLSELVGKLLEKPVQEQVTVDYVKSADALAERGDRNGAIAQYKLAILRGSAPTQAYGNLANVYLSSGDFLNALNNLDNGIEVAHRQSDPFESQLKVNRINVLRNLKQDELERSPALKDYVCLHNFYVVAASAKGDGEPELSKVRSVFPNAEIGEPHPAPIAPIIAEAFLTCDQAQHVVNIAEYNLKTHPFIERWYVCDSHCPSTKAATRNEH